MLSEGLHYRLLLVRELGVLVAADRICRFVTLILLKVCSFARCFCCRDTHLASEFRFFISFSFWEVSKLGLAFHI
ncbi:hypothetical protein HanOQP8_Chr01g0024201 [Helianthus annuus]|nr:hypothetical protein HanOQP8_Chr01g0024201 [Helianthus annuus]